VEKQGRLKGLVRVTVAVAVALPLILLRNKQVRMLSHTWPAPIGSHHFNLQFAP
jgi:hypothetical protein